MEEEEEWLLVEDGDLSKGRALEKISNLYASRVVLIDWYEIMLEGLFHNVLERELLGLHPWFLGWNEFSCPGVWLGHKQPHDAIMVGWKRALVWMFFIIIVVILQMNMNENLDLKFLIIYLNLCMREEVVIKIIEMMLLLFEIL